MELLESVVSEKGRYGIVAIDCENRVSKVVVLQKWGDHEQ